MNGWFGFWLFMTVLLVCDTYFYNKGHDGLFWEHKTPEEKEMQRNKIDAIKSKGE